MPYVTQTRREQLDAGEPPESTGDLAYLLTRVVDDFLAAGERRFDRYAAAVGALEASKLELYRRVVGPYEDLKLAENGEVYSAADHVRGLLAHDD